MNCFYLGLIFFIFFNISAAETTESFPIDDPNDVFSNYQEEPNLKINQNTTDLKLVPVKKVLIDNNHESKNLLGFDNLFGLHYGYLYGKINFNNDSTKTDDVPLVFYFTHFLSPKTTLDFEAMKIHGKRLNNRYLSPMYSTLKYSALTRYRSSIIKAGVGLNYYDNGIRREHDGIQRHIFSLFFSLACRREFSKQRAVNFEVHSSPQLSYTVEVPRGTNYFASASYFKMSSTYELPSLIIPAILTIHGNFQNYYYRFARGNDKGKSDKLLFLGVGILKKF